VNTNYAQISKSLKEITIKYTESIRSDPLVIPIVVELGNTDVQYGSITIPPKSFPAGWTIEVTQIGTQQLEKPVEKEKVNDCGDSSEEDGTEGTKAISSVAFNVDVFDQYGRKRNINNLDKKISFELFASLPEDERASSDRLGVYYLGDDQDRWKSLESGSVSPTGNVLLLRRRHRC